MIFPPAAAMAEVEEFRREHDPLFHRIPAHITVVFPMETRDAAATGDLLRRALERLAVRMFPASTGGAGRYDDGVVFQRVGRGASELCALHEGLTAAVAPAGAERLPYLPHLTVGRATGESESTFLERQAAGRLPTVRFAVEAISLVVEDARGLWLETARFPLAEDDEGPRGTLGPIPLHGGTP